MAKNHKNIFLEGFRGSIGDQLVVKRSRGGKTIITKKPTFRADRTFSEAQLARQQIMREANVYAKKMKHHPVYLALAKGTARTGYNVAMSDWCHPPEILKVDTSSWTVDGGVIRVQAQDNVKVVAVQVRIADGSGTVLEEGEAQEAGAGWWEYRPERGPGEELQVKVSARDMPGHETEVDLTGFGNHHNGEM